MLPVYRNTGSRIHTLHPVVTLAFVLSIFSASLMTTDTLLLVLLFAVTVLVAAAGRILKDWAGIMRFTLYLSLSIFAISLIVLPKNTWWNLWGIPIPAEPILTVLPLILRLEVSVSAFLILSLTVNPDELLEVGSGSKTMMALAIGARLYPLIASDEAEIEDIMRIRGVEMDSGKRAERIKNRGALIIPLLIGSLERGMSMAESMESRSFSARKQGTSAFYRPLSAGGKVLLSLQIAAFFPVFLQAVLPSLMPTCLAVASVPLYLTVLLGGGRE